MPRLNFGVGGGGESNDREAGGLSWAVGGMQAGKVVVAVLHFMIEVLSDAMNSGAARSLTKMIDFYKQCAPSCPASRGLVSLVSVGFSLRGLERLRTVRCQS